MSALGPQETPRAPDTPEPGGTPESPTPPEPTPPSRRFPVVKALTTVVIVGVGAALLWLFLGRPLWQEYQNYLESRRRAEDTVPIGYIGLNYRPSYNNRPLVFHVEKGGRKLLWAAAGASGKEPEYYDVTEAEVDLRGVTGGFGRDSIPGIDYPILEPPTSERGRRLRARQDIAGLNLDAGPRAYPIDVLAKIEIVNDQDGNRPFVAVYDRGRDRVSVYERTVDGRPITFGTSGYSLGQKPLLYDRRAKSLWLPTDEVLACISGQLRGTKLPINREPQRTTWAKWSAAHPETLIVVGNDRSRPIPSE
jgi:hypothetical protein